jgi:hypothetical protein
MNHDLKEYFNKTPPEEFSSNEIDYDQCPILFVDVKLGQK